MLLGGLWHGASWNFVLWGGLHGVYLAVHRWWGMRSYSVKSQAQSSSWLRATVVTLLTFHLVSFTWIFFRAESYEQATQYFYGLSQMSTEFSLTTLGTAFLLLLSLLPLEWIQRQKSDLLLLGELTLSVRVSLYTALIIGIFIFHGNESPFIYFQF